MNESKSSHSLKGFIKHLPTHLHHIKEAAINGITFRGKARYSYKRHIVVTSSSWALPENDLTNVSFCGAAVSWVIS